LPCSAELALELDYFLFRLLDERLDSEAVGKRKLEEMKQAMRQIKRE
jgi:hypothetical protein